MASSGMLHNFALVRTDVSDELRASFIRATRTDELGTTLAVTSNEGTQLQFLVTANVSISLILFALMMEAICTSEPSGHAASVASYC
jgi:hypothetical protein